MDIKDIVEGMEAGSFDNAFVLPRDGQFRRGAHHSANWLARTASDMARQGKSAQEIADRLYDLESVVQDWREGHVEFRGNPWETSVENLDTHIKENTARWSGQSSDKEANVEEE